MSKGVRPENWSAAPHQVPGHEKKKGESKFTTRFFEEAHQQRNQYMASINRLVELLGDNGRLNSRKELYLSRLNTFDTALALFGNKRSFDKRYCEEHFDSVRNVPPDQRRNLSIGAFEQFHQRNVSDGIAVREPIKTKPPLKISTLFSDVSMMVSSHVDQDSKVPACQAGIGILTRCDSKVRVEMCSGHKNELMSGFLAIKHPTKNDMIVPIYLSDQTILMSDNDLIARGFMSKHGVLNMNLCLNKYTRADGKLAKVFLDDLYNHNKEISAEIRSFEARQRVTIVLPSKGRSLSDSLNYVDESILISDDELEQRKRLDSPRKRKAKQPPAGPSAKTRKQDDVTLAALWIKLEREVKKLERDEEVLEKWRKEWRLSVADYSEEQMIAENVKQEYEINNERGFQRIRTKRAIIEQLKGQIKSLSLTN